MGCIGNIETTREVKVVNHQNGALIGENRLGQHNVHQWLVQSDILYAAHIKPVHVIPQQPGEW